MRNIAGRILGAFLLVAAGYGLGSAHLSLFAQAQVRTDAPPELPTALRDRLREAGRVLSEVQQVLVDEKRYVPATQGLNAFATSVGGVDAIADLESGQGVDPETFAGLYSGQALAELADHLARDTDGHLTYKNKVVRVYSAARMKQFFTMRADLVPVGAPATKTAAPAAAAPKKQPAAEPEKKEE